MKITVTAEDIREGTPGDPTNCPVARAVKRATGEEWLSVFTRRVHIWETDDTCFGGRGTKKVFTNSESLARFIQRFDGLRVVKPASFILREAQ
jgi:hypothetical protein